MQSIFKRITICLLIAAISPLLASSRFQNYCSSLSILDPGNPEDIAEYNLIKQCLLLNIEKERQNPSVITSREWVHADGGWGTPTHYTMPLAEYLSEVVYEPTTSNDHCYDNPEKRTSPIERREHWSLLHLLAKKNDPDFIKRLCDYGANVNLQLETTIYGEYFGSMRGQDSYYCHKKLDKTALHVAIEYGSEDAAIALIQNDAQCTLMNAAHQTAYDTAMNNRAIRNAMLKKNSFAYTRNAAAHAIHAQEQTMHGLGQRYNCWRFGLPYNPHFQF